MRRQDALMENVTENLHQFLFQINAGLSRPQKKFLRDGTISLIRAGRPIVCQMAREVPNQRSRFKARVNRLDAQLDQANHFDATVDNNLKPMWTRRVDEWTPIILDLSDLSKPYAKTMDYLATVRNGDTGELNNGYWLLEMYAGVDHKNPMPIVLEPFSHEQPNCPGQNPLILDAVHRVFKATEGRGVLVADRGFDGKVFFKDWLDHDIHFVTRLRGDRNLQFSPCFMGQNESAVESDPTLVMTGARLLAERTATEHSCSYVVKRKGKPKLRFTKVGWRSVYLPGRVEPLTMVVSRLAGHERPMMLLTNLSVTNAADAKRVLKFYLRRWECEEAIRFLKSMVGLEAIRTFNWTAICRLVLLARVVMMYMCVMLLERAALAERVIRFGQPLPRDHPKFLFYRLLRGLGELLNACFWLHRALLQPTL